ncbi:MAG: hypothetical protein M3Y72_25270 [Acidobacteriota bacterium]|jgi:hypothetical protein|nr:hypothetical protein [Acidobacteriota bacterium]
MLCDVGTELIRQYEVATKDRETARDILLTSSVRQFKVQDAPFEDLMLVAKQNYSQAFIAWVTHRASCAECSAVYGKDDQVQFASV